jgi:ribosomal protein S4E
MAITNPNRGVWDITASGTYEMIATKQNKGSWKSISINNQHASNDGKIKLYLDDGLGNTNSNIVIAGSIEIPAGVTLVLEDIVSFDNDVYALKVTHSGSGLPISIIAR